MTRSLGLFSALLVLTSLSAAEPTGKIDFQRDIRPILAEKCIGCHGQDKPEAGLRFTDRAEALKPAESGKRAIVPNSPAESELLRRVLTTDLSQRMPPEEKEPLTAAQVAKLKQWIQEGAEWTGHWAFQPLKKITPPAIAAGTPKGNEIDQFIIAALAEKRWSPSPQADKYTLIKRLYYDLIGLPPKPAEVDEFVNDNSAEAYTKVVERLLASRHFGERWGRHWLDMAHYADSDGYEKDRTRPDAYLFRDWTIDAINRDLPYDQFTIEQLAGDLLPQATSQQRIATAFLRQTLTNEEGGVDQEEYRVNACFDRTETIGTVWLGLTIGCVRCHGHKYDPLPHEEYYKLFAFFNNSEEQTIKVPAAAEQLDELEAKLQPLQAALFARYQALAPAEAAWEQEARQFVLSKPKSKVNETPLAFVAGTSKTAADGQFVLDAKTGDVTAPDAARDYDTYTLSYDLGEGILNGLRLWTIADKNLPKKGPGLSKNGNFVLTGMKAWLVVRDQPDQELTLPKPTADYAQPEFPAANILKNDSKTGWAVGGKTGVNHSLSFQFSEPIKVPANAKLKVVIEQNYGKEHLLGKFRLVTFSEEIGMGLTKPIVSALEMYPEKRIANTRKLLFDFFVRQIVKDQEVLALEEQIAEVQRKHKAKMVEVRTVAAARLPRTTAIFHRGDFLSPKEKVVAGVPGILPRLVPRGEIPDRLDLARWIVSPNNDLTPRVAVNQIWLHLFGQGLVRTPTDFGVRGERPSHPELLDWLAEQFRGPLHWSRKDLIRLIVHSATYQQASHHRPELESQDSTNLFLFRQNRFRVEAETVRDLNLAVAGLLSPKIGGPSVFPPMPADLAKLSYANNFSWKNSEGEDRYRRGMYTFFKRTIPHPNLMTFDAPDANVACVIRSVSNTPLQSLALLNNESHVEASQALARRLQAEITTGDAARLTYAFRLAVGRPPAERELATLQRVLESGREFYGKSEAEAKQLTGKYAPAEVPISEAAAWVVAARVVLNLDEFLTRE